MPHNATIYIVRLPLQLQPQTQQLEVMIVRMVAVKIVVAKLLVAAALSSTAVVIGMLVTNVPIGLTRADTDVIVMVDIAFALLLALDFVDVSFEVVGSKLIAILAGVAMDQFMAGFGVEALVVAS